MLAYSSSMASDTRLLGFELQVTRAHAISLSEAGILTDAEAAEVTRACDTIEARPPAPGPGDEDVHGYVERLLSEHLGEAGRKIHAGRSRNELIAADMRLFCIDRAEALQASIQHLIAVLLDHARQNLHTVLPGYTHMQRAQPVSLGFHLLAHCFALMRDAERFRLAAKAADISPLGAGALAGTTLPLDPQVTAARAGFSRPFDNAMDIVSDRDFAADLLYACALAAVHISRLGEEIVLWTSSEFGFAGIHDSWSTGSSLMPQKRNPDIAEIGRGHAGRAIGDITALLALLKGLPLAYDRDLQELNPIVIDGTHRTLRTIDAISGLVGALTFDEARMKEAAKGGYTWATDLAERLVMRGIPFRDAHEAVGGVVSRLEQGEEVSVVLGDEPFKPDDAELMQDPAFAQRSAPGGPAPERVADQIASIEAWLGGAT
jgi:argininosuccinate lyase